MKLPPLNALRAFEAAARHNGYTAAADELCVTRGAISRQVRLLEEHLGVALFHRHARGVTLTETGKALLPVLSDCFSRISRETARIGARADDLRLICPPGLSIRWLFPRLADFRGAHPGIRVRLTTDFYGQGGLDPAEHDLGLSLEHWPGRRAGLKVQPLFPMLLAPACAPSLLEGRRPVTGPHDLTGLPLLHESPTREDWATWTRYFDVTVLDPANGETFPNLDLATRAATMGGGLVMADLFLCREELESGALVLPLPHMACATPHGRFALIGAPDSWELPNVRAFRDWAGALAAEDMHSFFHGANGIGRTLPPETALPPAPNLPT